MAQRFNANTSFYDNMRLQHAIASSVAVGNLKEKFLTIRTKVMGNAFTKPMWIVMQLLSPTRLVRCSGAVVLNTFFWPGDHIPALQNN